VMDAIYAVCANSSRPSHPSAGWVSAAYAYPTTAVDFGSYVLYECLQEMQATSIVVSSTLGDRVPVNSGIAPVLAFFCVVVAIGYIFWRLRVAHQRGDCSRRGKILRRGPTSLDRPDPPARRVAATASTPAPVQVSAVPTVLAIAAEHTPSPNSHVDTASASSSRADVASTSFEVEAENSSAHNNAAELTGAQTLDGSATPKEIPCSLARSASAVTLTAVEDDADPDDAQPSIEKLARNTTDNPLSTNDV